MLRVYINDGIDCGSEYLLSPDPENYLMIGCGEGCHIRIPRSSVADHHALIAWSGGRYYVVDQHSGRETLLNGRVVDTEWLEDGDSLEIGRGGPRLTVSLDGSAGSIEPETAPVETRQIINYAAEHIGLYDPEHDSGRPPRSLGMSILLTFYALLGLMLLGLMGLNLGISIAFVSSLAAFLPALFYLGIFLWLDRFDPEPPRTLAFAFGWGATISVLFSGFLNDLGTGAIGDLLTGIFLAPFVEELLKGFGVFLIAFLFRKDFDSVVDGIIYAGVVALGFAAMENVDYYGRSFARGGIDGLKLTFMVRGLMAPFSHVLFTSMTGIGAGIARESHHAGIKFWAPLIGLGGAMINHGMWNAMASFDRKYFIAGYIFFEVPLFICFLLVIVWVVRREGRILAQTLAAEVDRGLITERQLAITISIFSRTIWLSSALGHPGLLKARRRFLRSVAKLGLCLWHRDRAAVARKDTGSLEMIERLRAEIFMLRGKVDD
ncbi:MAG: PrsW family intramembrane metalloprotease [Acidobacteriota bacterium]|nr:MAG: PrsW family intramembrane metalloprotease [Acidobacteriota bacterium]